MLQPPAPPVSVQVISCGQLPTPGNGRKSTFAFTPGTMVKFDCDAGYVLVSNIIAYHGQADLAMNKPDLNFSLEGHPYDSVL